MKIRSAVQYSLYGGAQRHYTLAVKAPLFLLCMLLIVSGSAFAGHLQRSVRVSPAPQATASQQAVSVAPKTETLTDTPAIQQPDLSAAVTGALQTAFAEHPSVQWSAAVYDLTSDKWLAQVDADRSIPSASLYKLYATYALAQKVPYNTWDSKKVGGHSLSVCVDRMLRLSDNTCGEAVGHLLGWPTIDSIIHAYGFNHTTLSNTKTGMTTTANDTTAFMRDLYEGKLVSADVHDSVMQSLKLQYYRNAIPTGCKGCEVYNKTGLLPGVAHDSAIVKSGDITYAVTIMSQGKSASYQQIADVERALEAVLHPSN